jgi:NCAIR mutase (PurE)-related protein
MDQEQLRQLLGQVQAGALDVDAALVQLRHMPFEDLGFAKVDHHRALRHGMPEVILAKGKTPEQVAEIAARLLDKANNVLATRADERTADLVRARFAEAEYSCRPSACGATAPSEAKAKSPSSAPAPATCSSPKRRRSPPK